ncbi:MAG TPA: DUF3341 domain-containing protein [Polyangiaceae bacterium]|nr:DUF3341 domain-containing protein [Polyangiaceae bacterium]
MKKAVIGFAATQNQAEAIATRLRSEGFATNDISVLFPDKRNTKEFAHKQSTKAPEGATAGAGAGGIVGGTLGLLAGIGALAIPGLGPFIAAGPIMAALSGAAAGAGVGGVTGALIGMGIPEYEAKMYEGTLREGNILLSVHTEDDTMRKRALEIFKEMGVKDAKTKTEASVPRDQRR